MSAGKSMPSPSAKLFRLSHLRKLRQCEQVAAVCYRTGRSGVEFLLIRTGKSRWIFPKGGVEPGLSHAQSAALEAFEEAGVHGRMEEASFARYSRSKRGGARNGATVTETVSAHLCEVTRLVTPEEANRNPTWFSVEKTKKRLLEGRPAEFGAELIRVVDRAVARIERVHQGSQTTTMEARDALHKVQFEAALPQRDATLVSPARRFQNSRGAIGGHAGRVLQLGPALVMDSKRTTKVPPGAKRDD